MNEFDKKLKREINLVKKHIRILKNMGLTIETEDVETMYGRDMTHVYLRDRFGDRGSICLQKYLFSLDIN